MGDSRGRHVRSSRCKEADFSSFMLSAAMCEHCVDLLWSREMEFLSRLQTSTALHRCRPDDAMNSRFRDAANGSLIDRPWLRQQRRNVDLGNLGRQDDERTFEIDWRRVRDIANDCGLSLSEGQMVPFPLMMVDRYVAMDYDSHADSLIVMTHRRANNAYAALLLTYRLLGLDCVRSQPSSTQAAIQLFDAWSQCMRNGGNYSREESGGLISESRQCRDNLMDAVMYRLLFTDDCMRRWKSAVGDDENDDAVGSDSSVMNDITSAMRDIKKRNYGGYTHVPSALRECIKGIAATQPLTDGIAYDGICAESLYGAAMSMRAIALHWERYYPVLTFIPVPAERVERRSYAFGIRRYADLPRSVDDALRSVDATLEHGAGKRERFNRKLLVRLLFREINRPYQWLGTSTFMVHKLAKDVRPALMQDMYDGAERSVITEDEIYTSLHRLDTAQPVGQPELCGRPLPDDERNSKLHGFVIPRFRTVIPMLSFAGMQLLLMVLYVCITKVDATFSPLTGNSMADDWTNWATGMFRVVALAQLGATFFIAGRDESSTVTRMLRIPRYAALCMVPAQLWMIYNITYGWSAAWPPHEWGWLWGLSWSVGASAAATLLFGLYRWWGRCCAAIAVSVAGMAAALYMGAFMHVPFAVACGLLTVMAVWLAVYFWVRFVRPQYLGVKHPSAGAR